MKHEKFFFITEGTKWLNDSIKKTISTYSKQLKLASNAIPIATIHDKHNVTQNINGAQAPPTAYSWSHRTESRHQKRSIRWSSTSHPTAVPQQSTTVTETNTHKQATPRRRTKITNQISRKRFTAGINRIKTVNQRRNQRCVSSGFKRVLADGEGRGREGEGKEQSPHLSRRWSWGPPCWAPGHSCRGTSAAGRRPGPPTSRPPDRKSVV